MLVIKYGYMFRLILSHPQANNSDTKFIALYNIENMINNLYLCS